MISKKTFSLILFFLTPVLLLSLFSSWRRHAQLERRFEDLEIELKQLEEDKKSLTQSVELASVDILKEYEIRKRLNFTKPGEVLVIFVSPSPIPTALPEVRFFDKLWKFFKRD